MNFSFRIAKRLYFDKEEKKRPVSKLATNIATWGIGIGLAVMIATICIVLGFKEEISSKVIGFGSDIEIFSIETSSSPESSPINGEAAVCDKILKTKGVKKIQRTSNKFGIIKTNTDYKCIVFKGIDSGYDTEFLKKHLIEGKFPSYGTNKNENLTVISKKTADEMHLKVGEKFYAYFFDQNIKIRRFTVSGIFSTDIQQFDNNIVFANRHTINILNSWKENQCSTIEVKIEDFSQLDDTYGQVLHTIHTIKSQSGDDYVAYTIKQLYAQIFDWLQLLNLNIAVILTLMAILSCLTMISGLLILILEKTPTIGILKALGSNNTSIRKIFLYYAAFIVTRGIALGYIIGLGLMFIQQNWHVVKLDSAKYYVSSVPVLFNWPILIGLGLVTLVICVLSLIGPSYIVSRIVPSKAIKFE